MKGAYNAPTCNEVCVVYDHMDALSNRFNLRLYPIAMKPFDLNSLNPNTDPLTYPLLFPHGCQTFKILTLKKKTLNSSKNKVSDPYISRRQYYACLLRDRVEFAAYFHAGKLTQQFIIDSFK